jgi:hypothetical protein
MQLKAKYFLICNGHYYRLYKSYHQGAYKLITTERNCDQVVQRLAQSQVKNIIIFDNSLYQILKIEKSAPSLSLKEYFQWCFQKRKLFLSQVDFGLAKSLFGLRSMLMVGLPQSLILNDLVEMLDKNEISFVFMSYVLNLIYIIRKHLALGHPNVLHPLIIILDENMHMTLSFFNKKDISFIRNYQPSSQQPIVQQLKSAITDTIKYLEKFIASDQVKLVFYLQNYEKNFEENFSDSLFFYENSSNNQKDGPTAKTSFYNKLFSSKYLSYRLYPAGNSGGIYYNFFYKLSLVLKYLSLFFIISSVFLIYGTIKLTQKNRSLASEIGEMKKQSQKLRDQLSSLPLSPSQIQYVQKILQQSNKQNIDFFQFIDLISHVLNNKYFLQALFIKTKKSRLLVQPIEPEEIESFDDFLDMWQQTISDVQLITPPNESNPCFIIETYSPFQLSQ